MRKIAIGVVVGAMVLTACGGSSSKSSNSGSSGGSPTTAASGGSGGSDFSQLVAKAKTADFKVTFTDSSGKSSTLAQDGKGKESFTTDSSEYITDGTTTIQCDGTTASAQCTDMGASGQTVFAGLTAAYTTVFAAVGSLKSSVFNGHTSSETIAGRDATCVTIKPSDFGGILGSIAGKAAGAASITSCVDKESGYPLKYTGTNADGTTENVFLATAAGSSSPSDFVPPSTPSTLPTGISIPTP